MATLLELCKIKHHAIRSDGAKFLDGERNDALDTSWLTVNSSGRVTLQKGLYDELLVVKGEVSDEQIKAWAAMGAPFYDAAGNIVYEGAGGRIEMDKDGQRFIRSADGQTMIEMDTETGGARFAGDITGATGTFSGGISGGNGAFELTPSKLTIDTPQFTLDEAGNAAFSGDITGASGTFSGNLAAETVEYSNLKVGFARVTSARAYISASSYDYATITRATSPAEWNILDFGNVYWLNAVTQITINHNELTTLAGGALIQIGAGGSWSSTIDLSYAGYINASYLEYHNVGGYRLVAVIKKGNQNHVDFVVQAASSEDRPTDLKFRFKRHAIA